MLDTKTKQHINNARNVLVGKVPDPKAQVEQITTALIYKFMDDMDMENEELGGKIQFFTGNLKNFSWSKLMSRELSGDERWNIYTRALEAFAKAEQIPQLFRTIFKDAYLPYRDPQTLNLFLKEINEFKYDHSENLGNAFEYLLSILGSQGDAGQFRTPRHIIDFIVEVVDPKKDETILDPACGTAGFLISSYKHIKKINSSNYDPENDVPAFAQTENKDITDLQIQSNGKYKGDKLKPADRKKLAKNIVGYDISPDMVRLSLVNMYLHGFVTPQIQEYDTLTYEDKWDDDFDVILANPPFMTPKGGIRPHKRFQVQANRAEVLFVDYIAEHLKINGRAGIIVPEGIIFQSSNAYKKLRKMLVDDNYLFAVVSLPAGVFQPYAGVKTSILFLDKQLAKKSDDILFIKVENDGFDLGAQRRRIDKNDLPAAYKLLCRKKHETHEKFKEILKKYPNALLVKKEKIAENGDYNLTGDRYKQTIDYSNVKWPMVKLGDVAEIISGQSPQGKYYNNKNEGIPFYQGKTEFTKMFIGPPKKWTKQITKIAYPNDILMSVRAPVGPVNINTMKICIGRGLAAIRCSSKINYIFLFNLLKEKQSEIQGNSGAAFASINRNDIQSIKIPLPPLEIQEKIVAEIDGYQKIIDGARQIVDNWKPNIKINPDWPKVKLGDVCNIYNGSTPKRTESKYWINGNIPWFTIEDIREQGRIITYTKQKITQMGFKNSSVKLLPAKTVLLCCTASVGEYAITEIELTTNQQFNGLVVKNDYINKLNPYFLFNLSRTFKNELIRLSGKTSFNFVSVSTLKQLEIPLPPIIIQEKIVSEIEAEQKMVDECKNLIEIYEKKIKEKIAEVWGEI